MLEDRQREEILYGEDALLRPLALAFKRTVGAIERETGVHAMKWFCLAMLERNDGISQGEISQSHEIDPSRITRMAKSLESEGLIRRERDTEDNRVVRMYLTDEGRKMLEKLPDLDESFGNRVQKVLSKEELEELRRLLGLLAEAMAE